MSHKWKITIDDSYTSYSEDIEATGDHSISTMFSYIKFWLKLTSPIRMLMYWAKVKRISYGGYNETHTRR